MASASVSAFAAGATNTMHVAMSRAEFLLKLVTRPRRNAWLAPFADAIGHARSPHTWCGVVCALIACALAYPDRVAAQELWRGLDLGASVKSVRRAFPDATQPLLVTTLADGETDDLETRGLFLGDRLMEVRFFFLDGGLTAVMLSPVSVGPGYPEANLQFASDLSNRLTARYGEPFDCGDRSYADVDLYECKWLAKPIVVRLWYLDVAGQAPTLRIVYRAADDAAYDF